MFKMSRVLVSPLHHHTVHTLVHRTFQTSIHNFLILLILMLVINISHDVWIVENIFMNNYNLDECTYRCITHSVTAHPDDGQTRPKHAGATNWKNVYHLCILLFFISNYTTMHGVEHIKYFKILYATWAQPLRRMTVRLNSVKFPAQAELISASGHDCETQHISMLGMTPPVSWRRALSHFNCS
jgi:hypothetical protein